MGQIITHACGHEQIHYLFGFASQQERKAPARDDQVPHLFVATKQTDQAEAAVRDSAAIATWTSPCSQGVIVRLHGQRPYEVAAFARSLRVRARRGNGHQICALVTDAKWWIDHRALTDTELLAEAEKHTAAIAPLTGGHVNTGFRKPPDNALFECRRKHEL